MLYLVLSRLYLCKVILSSLDNFSVICSSNTRAVGPVRFGLRPAAKSYTYKFNDKYPN